MSPSRVSLARARSLFRPLLPSACYAGYIIYDVMDLVGIVNLVNLLTNLTATFVPAAKQWRAIQRVS